MHNQFRFDISWRSVSVLWGTWGLGLMLTPATGGLGLKLTPATGCWFGLGLRLTPTTGVGLGACLWSAGTAASYASMTPSTLVSICWKTL